MTVPRSCNSTNGHSKNDISSDIVARGHPNDISSEIVLISHCLYRMNVCLYSVIVLLLGKFNGGEVEVVGGAGIKQTPW